MFFKDVECPNCQAYHDPTLQECPECHKSNELFTLNRLPKRAIFLSPIAQVALFLIGFAYAGMLIAEIIFAVFIKALPNDASTKNTLLLVATYMTMFAGLISVPLLTRRKLFFSKFKNGIDYLYGIGYAVSIICIGTVIGLLISFIYQGTDNNNQAAAVSIVKSYPLIAYFVLGILGPICEELTYRVGLYSFLRRINKYLAFAVTVIVFALIHFDFSAADIVNELWALPTYLVCGFILTLAYEHRGPACSILAHMLYNSIAFIIMLVQ